MKNAAIILICGIVFSFCLAIMLTFQSLSHPIKYLNEISFYADKYNLEKSLVCSVVNVESGFNPDAKSYRSALGLMQIKLDTANYLAELYDISQINENALFEIETNLNFGCLYLRYLINKFQSINTALAAYNAGETRVKTWLKNQEFSSNGVTLDKIPFVETKNYVKKVNENIKFYKKV